MRRSDVFHAAALVMLIAAFMATLAASSRRPDKSSESDPPSISKVDDLSAELRRCRALGLQDAEKAHCAAVWGESRRRFFGRPARLLSPSTIEKSSATPTTSKTTEAVSGGAL